MACILMLASISSWGYHVASAFLCTSKTFRRSTLLRESTVPDPEFNKFESGVNEWGSNWETSDSSALIAETENPILIEADNNVLPKSDVALTPEQVEAFIMASNRDTNVVSQFDAQLGLVDSHRLVEVDKDGEPFFERFVYVDEHTCIGCTHCAGIAKSTFFMEEENGRARVYQQQGDAPSVIDEAVSYCSFMWCAPPLTSLTVRTHVGQIATCPVNCIHYVPWEELKSLEGRRQSQFINNMSRLVNQQEGRQGGRGQLFGGVPRDTGPLTISGNQRLRCSDCPSRACADCPMYGVGNNPKYLEREMKMKEKRKQRELRVLQDGEKRRVDL